MAFPYMFTPTGQPVLITGQPVLIAGQQPMPMQLAPQIQPQPPPQLPPVPQPIPQPLQPKPPDYMSEEKLQEKGKLSFLFIIHI